MKIFLKKEKKKSDNMVINVTKTSQDMKNKSSLSIENIIIEWEKNVLLWLWGSFLIKKNCSFIRESIRKLFFCAYVWKVLSKKTKIVTRNSRNFWIFRLCKFPPERQEVF